MLEIVIAGSIWFIGAVLTFCYGEPMDVIVWWPIYLLKWLLKTLYKAIFRGWESA